MNGSMQATAGINPQELFVGYRKKKEPKKKDHRRSGSLQNQNVRRCAKCGTVLEVRDVSGAGAGTFDVVHYTISHYCSRCKKERGTDEFTREW